MVASKSTILFRRLLLQALLLASGGFSALPVAADPYTLIHRFESKADAVDGDGPVSLTAAPDGTLYGATQADGRYRCGTVFSLTKPAPGTTTWTYDVLHQVGRSQGSLDGTCSPVTAPLLNDKVLYGTVYRGKTPATRGGSVYRLALGDKNNSILHAFDETSGIPTGLVLGPDGSLYGTTTEGGVLDGCDSMYTAGVLYRLRPGGGYHVVHEFGRGTGSHPTGALVLGPDGALYGTTSSRCRDGQTRAGTVFRVADDGHYSVVYDFTTGDPTGSVVFGPDGTLYGTELSTEKDREGTGATWSLKPGDPGEPWTFNFIHRFKSYEAGFDPCGLARDSAGNLYGVARGGPPIGTAILYRLSAPATGTDWTYKILHEFNRQGVTGGIPNEGDPDCVPLVVGNILYGVTNDYGRHGTIFKYDLGSASQGAKR